MKVVAITQNRGGVGKTFIAVHLAWYLAERGYKVIFIDLDEDQADGIRWISRHKIQNPEAWKVVKIKENLDAVWGAGAPKSGVINKEKYDVAVIDGRPSVSVGAGAYFTADLIILPVEGRLSVENAKRLVEMIEELKTAKKRIVVVNRQNMKSNISKIQFDLAKLIDGELFPFPLAETVRVKEAENRGVSIWEVKTSPARRVFDAFFEYLEEVINAIK